MSQVALVEALAEVLEVEDDDLEAAVGLVAAEQPHGLEEPPRSRSSHRAAGAPPGCAGLAEPFDLADLHTSALRRALRTFGLALLLSSVFCFGVWLALLVGGVGL